ncbi:MAG: glycosyltransferase family 39 protein [bacterium]|nr:glycosyltransferase family 39 protein [bacterium]
MTAAAPTPTLHDTASSFAPTNTHITTKTASKVTDRVPWLPLIALFLFMTWLGGRGLNADGIWVDEWWSWYNAGGEMFGPPLSPVEIWNRVAVEDFWQAPGYPLLLSAWGNLTGWSEFSTRALSLLAGVLAVAVTYRLGKAISGSHVVALGAAVALGANAWFIFYLHEMRVYTLYVLFTALSILLYWQLMAPYWNKQADTSQPRPLLYIGFVLSNIALLYTQYYALLTLGVLGLLHLAALVRRRPNRHWWLVLGCFLLAGVTFLPWLYNVIRGIPLLREGPRQIFNRELIIRMGTDTFYLFSSTSTALFALVALVGLRLKRAWLLWAVTGVLLLLNVAITVYLRLGEMRYLMSVMPLLALMFGLGVEALRRATIRPAWVLGLWVASAFFANGNNDYELVAQYSMHLKQPVREFAEVINPRVQPGEPVIYHLGETTRAQPNQFTLVQYLGLQRFEIIEPFILSTPEVFEWRVDQAIKSPDDNPANAPTTFWVGYSPRWPSDYWELFNYLMHERDIFECAQLLDTPDLQAFAYARFPAEPTSRMQYNAPPGTVTVTLMRQPDIHNGMLRVWLGFEVPEVPGGFPSDTYSVGVHVVNADGALVAQSDYGLPQADYALPPLPKSCRMVEIPAAALPAGAYTIRSVIYQWNTNERLLTEAEQDYFDLAALTVP